MGEYAEYELENAMYHGSPVPTDRVRRRKLVECPDCGKPCRGQGGVMQHQKAKHGAKWTWSEIDSAPVEYEER